MKLTDLFSRNPLIALALSALLPAFPAFAATATPELSALPASAKHLPRWRGFNLLNRFDQGWSNRPFSEDDFKMISELGFNFVRIPMDYRTWIVGGDWNKLDETELKKIDEAVAWGRKYHLHVCLNFHRAPGYTVNSPKETTDLFSQAEPQAVCAKHWAAFAKRYKGIPSSELSFNLLNEPAGSDIASVAKVETLLAQAIWKEDPNRLVIADGYDYGNIPVTQLVPVGVAQATRGYQPFGLTHYKANWVAGSDNWAVPLWPVVKFNAYLYGTDKKDLTGPLVFEGTIAKKSDLVIHVNTVSRLANLIVLADGKAVLTKKLAPGEGAGEWKTSVYKPEWKIYQNVYDKDYSAPIPAGTKRVEISVSEGDWLTFDRMVIAPSDGSAPSTLTPTGSDWGVKQGTLYLDASGKLAGGTDALDKKFLWDKNIAPWKTLEAMGVGVMVGEWGAYNQTPHDVVLKWMKDCLENWKEAGWGWALWNFTGDFGVLDSNRSDVVYEDFHGHKLDRKMLELLQSY